MRRKSPSSRRAWIEICNTCSCPRCPLSPSSRRAWIEIKLQTIMAGCSEASPSSRRAWIEILKGGAQGLKTTRSPSSRRAWIEMGLYAGRPQKIRVALLAEGVDRNKPDLVAGLAQTQVALLAEGVDRNCTVVVVRGKVCVALLAEGVDRNPQQIIRVIVGDGRPPRGGRG